MNETKTLLSNVDWFRAMADQEDATPSILVGGLAISCGFSAKAVSEDKRIFGRLIQLSRRSQGLSMEALAKKANIDLQELFGIEHHSSDAPSPRTIFQLASELSLPQEKLMQLCGLAESRDDDLQSAALRFAARSDPTTQLTKEEKVALEEFVGVLTDRSESK